jgi:5-methylcytosine-specific restriction endonuclease McrA
MKPCTLLGGILSIEREEPPKSKSKGHGHAGLKTATWEWIKRFWGNKCVYCGHVTSHLTVEHIIPTSRGGTRRRVDNVMPACRDCNEDRGNMDIELFASKEVLRQIKLWQLLCGGKMPDTFNLLRRYL